MKRVLVTGATGFIGNYVIAELIRLQCSVIATSSDIQKAESKSWFNNVTHIPFDLRTFSADVNYFDFFDQPDLIIHLAWEGLPNYKQLFHLEDNLPRHYQFIKNLVVNGLKDVLVTGTCLEYGMQEGCLREDMAVHPANPYAVAKDSLRRFLAELQKFHPFAFKWTRLFYMYGKGQSPNSLLSQLEFAISKNEDQFNMSGGEQMRDYLPVEQVAEYIVKIALQQNVTGVINCCSGKPVMLKDFVRNYLIKNNKNIKLNLGYYPYTDYEPFRFWGDNSKLKMILNDQ